MRTEKSMGDFAFALRLMWRLRFIGTLWAWACAMISLDHGARAEDLELRARFLSEYPVAARKLRQRLEHVELQMELQYDHAVDGPARRTFYFRDGLGCDFVEPLTERPRHNIYNRVHLCTRHGQLCILYQHQPKGGYTIFQSEVATEKSRAEFLAKYVDDILFACVSFGPPITDYLCNPANLKQVEAIEGPNQEQFVQVDFTVPEGEETRLKGGRLIFHPDQDWVLRRYEDCKFVSANGDFVALASGERTFRQLENGAWVPQSMSSREKLFYDQQWHETDHVREATFLSATVNQVSLSRFDLSNYGLVTIDPIGAPKRNHLRMLLLLNGLVLFGFTLTWWCFRSLTTSPKHQVSPEKSVNSAPDRSV